jgi:DNA-directed RNA polymerase specialized sigma24 family protein
MDIAPESAEAIWNEFFPRMIRLARKKLDGLACREFDEEDVAQSAMNSFFQGQAEGRFERLSSKDEMWRLLATITVRKAIRQRRRQIAEKRGAGSVRGESVFYRLDKDQAVNELGLAAMQDNNLMPETTDAILRTCDDLLQLLPDEKLRRTAVLRLEGFSNQEISDELQCSIARTKQRLQRIRELWSGTVS